MLRTVPRTPFVTPNAQVERPAATDTREEEAASRRVRSNAGLGVNITSA
jgi:hypothetical protein